MRDENGKLKRGVNFEMLKQMLSPDVVDGDECYEFTWAGKKASIVEANNPVRKSRDIIFGTSILLKVEFGAKRGKSVWIIKCIIK